MDELKPCPFCGGSARLHSVPDGEFTHWWVRCDVCGAESGSALAASTPDQEFAITAWNTRHASGDLNEHFGKPEQFDVNEQSGNSRQLASLEQRAEDLLRVARNGWFETSDPVPHGAAIRAITAALANQQGVEFPDVSDAEISAWLDRHDLSHAIRGADARAAFEDAQSFVLTMQPTQPAGEVGRES